MSGPGSPHLRWIPGILAGAALAAVAALLFAPAYRSWFREDDIRNVRRVELVVANGRRFKPAELRR